MKLSQLARVEQILKRNGQISRNALLDCPTDKILRLGAIINVLRNDGWSIETEETDTDTIYHANPKKVEAVYAILPDGTRMLVKTNKIYQ